MVAVRLTPPFSFVVVGSPDYLLGRRRPEHIDDLRDHACLRMRRSNGSIAPWPFIDGNTAVEAIVAGPLIAHDYPTLLGAAIQGLGLAQVPGPLAKAPVPDEGGHRVSLTGLHCESQTGKRSLCGRRARPSWSSRAVKS
jgi:DNA-binding transcriptional LysR family regulator